MTLFRLDPDLLSLVILWTVPCRLHIAENFSNQTVRLLDEHGPIQRKEFHLNLYHHDININFCNKYFILLIRFEVNIECQLFCMSIT